MELTLEELQQWYIDTYVEGNAHLFIREGDGWKMFYLDIDNLLTRQQQMDYIQQLTSIVSTEFYAKYTQEQVAANPDLTYDYYYSMVEATDETKLRALHQAYTIRKNNE